MNFLRDSNPCPFANPWTAIRDSSTDPAKAEPHQRHLVVDLHSRLEDWLRRQVREGFLSAASRTWISVCSVFGFSRLVLGESFVPSL